MWITIIWSIWNQKNSIVLGKLKPIEEEIYGLDENLGMDKEKK